MSDVNVGAAIDRSVSVADLLNRPEQVGSGSWVTVVVSSDELANGWLVVESEPTAGERWCAVVSVDPVAVVAVRPASEMVLRTWSITNPAVPSWVPVLAASSWEAARTSGKLRETSLALNREQVRLESIVDAAHAFADEHSLCSVFDTFMLNNGLRPRSRDYDVVVDVSLRLRIPSNAPDSDVASDQVGNPEVIDALYNLTRAELSVLVDDFAVVDVEAV